MSLCLVLTPLASEVPAAQWPTFKASIRNQSDVPMKICTYMLHHRLLGGMSAVDAEGLEYALYPFKRGRWVKFKPSDVRTLGPKKSLADEIVLAKESTWGFVRTGSQPPILSRRYIVPQFPKGAVRFCTFLADRVSLYVGRDDMNDFTWNQRVVPNDLPGVDARQFDGVDQTLLRAEMTITFV